MGWTDLGCFGSDLCETPNIDRLAAEGVRFTQAYSACTVCSPTRAAVMTGKYPARLRVTDFIPGHDIGNTPLLIPDWTQRLELEETTLAEALKPAGYHSASIGKWHLTPRDRDDSGSYPEFYPDKQGFDLNIGGNERGAPAGYFWPYGKGKGEARKDNNLFRTLPPGGEEGEFLTDRLTEEALKIIDGWAGDPFFIYFPYYVVHQPLMAKQELIEEYKAKVKEGARHTNPVYAAMVHSLDESVGRLLAKLDEKGIADRTVVIFTSDNGGLTNNPGNPERTTSNLPLRQGKGSIYEGGVRVPAIVKWPGHTPPGSVSDEPIISIDYFPTLLDIADVSYEGAVDGVSLVNLLEHPGSKLDREAIYWHYPHYHMCGGVPYSAVREGDWKLIHRHLDDQLELYHLSEDIHEDHNLAQEEGAKTRELLDKLEAWRASVSAQMPTPNPDYDPNTPVGWSRNGKVREPEPVRVD